MFGFFLAFAVVSLLKGSQQPTKSISESELHAWLVVGAISGIVAVLCFIWALSAKLQKGQHDVS